jgi:hypothetical protein
VTFGETVGVIRPTTSTDRYGNASRVYGGTITHEIGGCAFAPAGSSEVNDARTAVMSEPAIYCPPGADLTAADHVLVRGSRYEVHGEPADWRDPFGSTLGGVVATLRKVEG